MKSPHWQRGWELPHSWELFLYHCLVELSGFARSPLSGRFIQLCETRTSLTCLTSGGPYEGRFSASLRRPQNLCPHNTVVLCPATLLLLLPALLRNTGKPWVHWHEHEPKDRLSDFVSGISEQGLLTLTPGISVPWTPDPRERWRTFPPITM